jgi:hypothetical protein
MLEKSVLIYILCFALALSLLAAWILLGLFGGLRLGSLALPLGVTVTRDKHEVGYWLSALAVTAFAASIVWLALATAVWILGH